MMLLIDLGKPYKLPVGSRTSSLPLVTAFIFYKILEFLLVYIRTVHLITNGKKEGYYVLELTFKWI